MEQKRVFDREMSVSHSKDKSSAESQKILQEVEAQHRQDEDEDADLTLPRRSVLRTIASYIIATGKYSPLI